MNEAVTEAGYDGLLRRDFASFVRRCFRELYPRTTFSFGPHVEIIAAKLTAVLDGETPRLIINLPPRHLKSLLASVAFPAWCLGRNPSAQILCVSYAQELADKLSRDWRRIVASDWYRRVLPTRLAPRHQAVPEFETTAQGCRIATSVGAVLTGTGCRHHRHRRSAEARGGIVRQSAAGRQRMVRPHPLQSSERQAAGRHRADHAATARGRSGRSHTGTGRMGHRPSAGDRRR
jgi:hypothetical protein